MRDLERITGDDWPTSVALPPRRVLQVCSHAASIHERRCPVKDPSAGAASVEQLLQPVALTLRSRDADVVKEAPQSHDKTVRRCLDCRSVTAPNGRVLPGRSIWAAAGCWLVVRVADDQPPAGLRDDGCCPTGLPPLTTCSGGPAAHPSCTCNSPPSCPSISMEPTASTSHLKAGWRAEKPR